MKQMAPILAAVVALTTGATTAQEATVMMVDLARNPDAYVGKRIIIADCMAMTWSSIIGIQCSPAPLDPTALAYVDVDTMSAAAKQIGADCDSVDIHNKCLLKVTGDVAKNSRGQALIKNATLEILKRLPAI